MGKGGYEEGQLGWLRMKTVEKKIYGVKNRTKLMNYLLDFYYYKQAVSELANLPGMGTSCHFLKAMGFSTAILFQFAGHSRQFHLQLLVYKYHCICN